MIGGQRHVELVGGHLDGAVLTLPGGALPARLGIVEQGGRLHPVSSATARLLLVRSGSSLYDLSPVRGRSGAVRYVLNPTPLEGRAEPVVALDELLDDDGGDP